MEGDKDSRELRDYERELGGGWMEEHHHLKWWMVVHTHCGWQVGGIDCEGKSRGVGWMVDW